MVGDPVNVVLENQARAHDVLGELRLRDPVSLMSWEVNSGVLEHLDRLWVTLLFVEVESEVELPTLSPFWHLSLFVVEGNSQLNKKKFIAVCLHHLIHIV